MLPAPAWRCQCPLGKDWPDVWIIAVVLAVVIVGVSAAVVVLLLRRRRRTNRAGEVQMLETDATG